MEEKCLSDEHLGDNNCKGATELFKSNGIRHHGGRIYKRLTLLNCARSKPQKEGRMSTEDQRTINLL